MNSDKNVWFVNFNGLGNGVMIAPFLACFESSYPQTPYLHTENGILSDPWFRDKSGIRGPMGYSPISWRRFSKEYWPEISGFIHENNIGTIINLRNEGPKYDLDYYAFKTQSEESLAFIELDFDKISSRPQCGNLMEDIKTLFIKIGVDMMDYNPLWLKDSSALSNGIGFGIAASNTNKRWSSQKWLQLGNFIKDNQEKVFLFPGISEAEKREAKFVSEGMEADNEIMAGLDIVEVTRRISSLKLFIVNDTGLLHIASAADVPTIGLYTATDPSIWSPLDKSKFTYFKNEFLEKCPYRKVHCGNCVHYYDECTVVSEYGDGINPQEVAETVMEVLKKSRICFL